MRFNPGIMGCCGAHGFYGMEGCADKESFLKAFISAVRTMAGYNFPLYGAFIQVNTASYQRNPEKWLKELGFTNAFAGRNSNSGNRDTLWVMSVPDFNRMITHFRQTNEIVTPQELLEKKRIERNAKRREAYKKSKALLAA